ncbi:MAG: proline racemase [Peptococcaceae bacterium BICA1-7]|nr:MAG: proline racemase [Peptococcaceae bacterium BICA1-7]HBV98382.1 proline racemase [Desulfotomaculum sp.]
MKSCKRIYAVDSHTMGEPTRVVIDGLGSLPGNSMKEKRDYIARNMDYIRTALMHEPRGHQNMFGAILCKPADEKANLGLVFMDGSGYLDMCVHGSIGAVTVAIELGIIDVKEVACISLETPAGLIYARAEVRNGKVGFVTIENVPSFLFRETVPLDIPGLGRIRADIAYGGNFFALVEAKEIGIEISLDNINRLVNTGMDILHQARKEIEVAIPGSGKKFSVDLVELYGEPEAEDAHAKNVVIFGNGQFDRSPCGTGTCAKMALLHATGKLQLACDYVNESIIGTTFRGRLIKETKLGNLTAVVPEIISRAFITGIHQFVINPDDPLKYGFYPSL